MDFSTYFLGFAAGVAFTLCAVTLSLIFIGNKKSLSKLDKSTENTNDNEADEKYNILVLQRLAKVKTLSEKQQRLSEKVLSPSSISETQDKTNIVKEIEDMENEKYTLLMSILSDGYDPMLATRDPSSGAIKEKRLSSFVKNMKPYEQEEQKRQEQYTLQEAEKEFFNDDDDENKTMH